MAEAGPPWVEVGHPKGRESLPRLCYLLGACNSLCSRRCRRDVLSGCCFMLRFVCCGLRRTSESVSSGLAVGYK